jgi:hypothetical protein
MHRGPSWQTVGGVSEKSELFVRPAHDLGGLPPGGPLIRGEREMTPFEKKSCGFACTTRAQPR